MATVVIYITTVLNDAIASAEDAKSLQKGSDYSELPFLKPTEWAGVYTVGSFKPEDVAYKPFLFRRLDENDNRLDIPEAEVIEMVKSGKPCYAVPAVLGTSAGKTLPPEY